tara:strand:- start:77 stop:433 length:357 start_codon:yes stop_codon:yes gene_type:complete
MKYYLILIYFFLFYSCSNNNEKPKKVHPNTITTTTLDFVPSELNCSLGDTIFFILGPSHNVIEVSEINFNENIPYPIKDGFDIGYGNSSFFIPKEAKTFYFICSTHLPQMKLRVHVKH